MSSICIKCGKEHDGTFGSGKFCSRQCSNSRNWTESDRQKKSASATKRLKAGKWGCLTNESRAQRIYTSKSWAEKVSSRPFEEMHFDYKRQKILLEQNYKCAICSINEWLGQQLSLEIDHKDGNHKNDERNNLHAICPNCHSLTSNFRGRNKLKGKFPPDREFYDKYKKEGNIRKTLLAFGLAAKGANYNAAKKIILRLEPLKSIDTILVY